ncbi:cytochrome P450 [Actinokineospora auranticolor]|uniref:Cytochrome P450 n=1 Tax=Actinokineospora auranticolor TaxID=155976 RepID=A0A2S6GT93_9PSEU|nr:cytochrome P450 [Actinokineospora auranticolor]PPK68444.1 cytochrome P450 [Actinokineospora auranticolor]
MTATTSHGQDERTTPEPADNGILAGLGLPDDLRERGGEPFAPPRGLLDLGHDGPVHRVVRQDGNPVWLVTGHAEARAVLSDPRMSSDRRKALNTQDLPEEVRARFDDPEARAGNFLGMDAPEHTRYRKLLTGQFTVRRMRSLEPRVTEIVTKQLDEIIAQGPPVDLVPTFALPVPSLVISELLGVDYADRAEFQQRTARMLRTDTPVKTLLDEGDKLTEFMLDLVRRKRAEPTDDLLSGLVHGSPEDPLTDRELANIANLLLIAGHETTANMLGLGTFALLENPDQLAALRDHPESVGTAVEELLRFLSIIHFGIPRTATADLELGGQRIAAGDNVMVSVQAANFDGAHYDNPEKLDLSRARGPHLSFGHGIHQCLGQQLARVEMTIGFTELLRRLPGLRLATAPSEVPVRTDMLIYGVHGLQVSWDA